MTDLAEIELTRWPRILVVGDPVTEEQANEIILRTTSWIMPCNDKAWLRMISLLTQIPLSEHHGMFDIDAMTKFERRHRVLRLEYLVNWRVASSWIWGPWGWCDWDGTIRLTEHSVGSKNPSVAALTEEWIEIAEAFPYLRLRSQALPCDEDSEEGGYLAPAVEWRVSEGRVETIAEPSELICQPTEPNRALTVVQMMTDPAFQRGVTPQRLSAALAQLS